MAEGREFNAYNREVADFSIKRPRPPPLALVMKNMHKREFPDVVVVIGRLECPCHLVVLQRFSNFFKREDIAQMHRVELPVSKVKPRIFDMLYDYGLDIVPKIKINELVDIYTAVTYLEVPELLDFIWSFMDESELLIEDYALLLFMRASKLKCRSIQELMLPRIRQCFLFMVISREFLQLTFEDIMLVFASSHLGVHNELEILFSGLRWLNFKWKRREKHLLEIVKCVRFTTIKHYEVNALTDTFLINVPNVDSAFDALRRPEVQEHIWKQLLIFDRTMKTELERCIEEPTDDLVMREVVPDQEEPRNAIVSLEIGYPYKLLSNTQYIYNKYMEFQNLLETLRGKPPGFHKKFQIYSVDQVYNYCMYLSPTTQ